MEEVPVLVLNPWTLNFSDRHVEARCRNNFLQNRIKEDVQWSLLISLPIVVFWWKVAGEVHRISVALNAFMVLVTVNWMTPAVVYYSFGRGTYVKCRSTVVTSTRYLRVMVLLLSAAYMRPGNVLQCFFADLIYSPVVVPWTFRLQFRDFVIQHGCLFLVEAYAFASSSGMCSVLCTTSYADQCLQVPRKIGDLMGVLQWAFATPPTVHHFGNLKYCRCIAVFWTAVAGFLVPALVFYVIEFRGRKSFASCCEDSRLEGSRAEKASWLLIQVAPMALIGVWQIIVLWLEITMPS